MNLKETAFQIAAIPAPSGFAGGRMDLIAKLAEELGAEIRRTAAGSLILRRAGEGRRIALVTHVDDGGFLATYQEGNGALRVNPLGISDFRAAYGAPVLSVKGVRGVVSADAGELKAAALSITPYGKTETGDAFALYQPAEDFDGTLVGAGLGSALSAAILLDVLADLDVNADLSLVFTGHHTLGARDAGAAVEAAAPDLAISLSALPAGKLSPAGDVVVCHQSGRAISDPMLVQQLTAAAEGAVQHDFAGPAVSDLGMIQKVGAGIPAAAMGFVMQHSGTLQESVLLADAEKAAEVLKKFVLQNA